MQADSEAAGACCRCYDNDRPIRTFVKQVSDSIGKHCRHSSIYVKHTTLYAADFEPFKKPSLITKLKKQLAYKSDILRFSIFPFYSSLIYEAHVTKVVREDFLQDNMQ